MKAAVCREFGRPLVVEEVGIDSPGDGEIKVKIAACGICQSDLHLITGEWGGEVPVIAGHEAAGIVVEVGPGVAGFAPGDPVVVTLLRACGHCVDCVAGQPYNCSGYLRLNARTPLHSVDGSPVIQGLSTAAFAEFALVHHSQVVGVPDGLPLESLALLACGVITGLGSVTRTAKVESGSRVAVIGVGGVGLNAVQGAVLSGASMIVAVDIAESKLKAAREFGATHVVNAGDGNPVEAIRELTGQRGVDYSFATVGLPSVISQAIAMVHGAGTAVVVGMPSNDQVMFSLNAHQITEGRRILGSKMGSTRLLVDVPRLVDLYREGRLKLDELISNRYPLEEINEAIASMQRGEAVRNVIVFP